MQVLRGRNLKMCDSEIGAFTILRNSVAKTMRQNRGIMPPDGYEGVGLSIDSGTQNTLICMIVVVYALRFVPHMHVGFQLK